MVDEVALIALIQDWTGCSDSDAVHTTKEVLKFFAGQADAVLWADPRDIADVIAEKPWTVGANTEVRPSPAGRFTAPLFTTPPAAIPVDALRELEMKWRIRADKWARQQTPFAEGSFEQARDAADDLAALIAGATP